LWKPHVPWRNDGMFDDDGMYASWNIRIKYAQVFLQLTVRLIILLLHVLAGNHSHRQRATKVKGMYVCCTGCHSEIVKWCSCLYRVSQEECARLREGVPHVKVYRYNPKHLCPKLNGYGDYGQRSLKL
jgi:hypothetical protein